MGFDRLDEVIPGPGLAFSVQHPWTPDEWATRVDEAMAFFECLRSGTAAPTTGAGGPGGGTSA